MELEELKESWKEMEKRIEKLETACQGGTDFYRGAGKAGALTAQNRLLRRYRLLTIVCCGLCVTQAGMFRHALFSELTGWLLPLALMSLACMNGYTWWCIARIDLYHQSLREVLKALLRQERAIRGPRTCIGLLVAFPVLASIVFDLYRNFGMEAAVPLGAGVIVGMFIGLHIRRRVFLDFREMKMRLEEEIGE